MLIEQPLDPPIFTVCHGEGGNAMLFLETFRCLKQEHWIDPAVMVAKRALAYWNQHRRFLSGRSLDGGGNPDDSLFMGTAGIGYFLLQLRRPLSTASIVAPSLPEPAKTPIGRFQHLSLDRDSLHRTLLQKTFQRTLRLPVKLDPGREVPTTAGEIELHLRHALNELKGSVHERCSRELFHLEQRRLQMECERVPILVSARQALYTSGKETFLQTDSDHRSGMILKTAEEVTLISSPCCMNPGICEGWDPARRHLLHTTVDGIHEMTLPALAAMVLDIFSRPKACGVGVDEICDAFEWDGDREKTHFLSLLERQIEHCVSAYLLLVGALP
jgi:hypothetical protein